MTAIAVSNAALDGSLHRSAQSLPHEAIGDQQAFFDGAEIAPADAVLNAERYGDVVERNRVRGKACVLPVGEPAAGGDQRCEAEAEAGWYPYPAKLPPPVLMGIRTSRGVLCSSYW